MGSWRQFLRNLCPANVAALLGAHHAEAVGLTTLVVAASVVIWWCNAHGGTSQSPNAERQGKVADPVDLWSGD